MRTITASIEAHFTVVVEVDDDATDEQVAEAIEDQCPKYPDVKAGQDFDPADFDILDDTREDI